jgi:transcription-repair coupling factor (superfamily II helicase)
MQDLDIRGAGNILGGEQSGFVTEIGYETYLRVLNEALLELREEGDVPAGAGKEGPGVPAAFTADCIVDTDLEMLIPEDYVESVSERVRLYRELDNLVDEAALLRFEVGLRDRFGEIPPPVKGLMEVVRARNRCQELGVERLWLKNGKMVMYFVSNPRSPFYASPLFTSLLKFVERQSIPCTMSERNGRLNLAFEGVGSMERAAAVIRQAHERIIGKEYPAKA